MMVREKLERIPDGHIAVHLADLLTRGVITDTWQRENVGSREEWFIKMCRAMELHCTWRPGRMEFVIRITRNEQDEATITWPGKGTSPTGRPRK
jgi:hypothetical protein